MKHINKNTEPIEFTEWKKQANEDWQPTFENLSGNEKKAVYKSLKKEQGYICCYCERELLNNDFHIEHFKPKDKNKFPELELEYSNLLCSCQNNLKKGDPRHCGNLKENWFNEELLISPLELTCESKFKYTFDGHIKANIKDDIKAKTTIEKLGLDIGKLVDMREKAIEPFLDETLSEDDLEKFTKSFLTKENDKFNPFYTTIEYLFG